MPQFLRRNSRPVIANGDMNEMFGSRQFDLHRPGVRGGPAQGALDQDGEHLPQAEHISQQPQTVGVPGELQVDLGGCPLRLQLLHHQARGLGHVHR